MKKREEKGITLIALIITIIVMLILVGVTVAVALNGGLFSTAKKAATETQYEADYEVLQEAVVGAIGKDGVVNESDIKLPNGWTVENGIYTSPRENKFIINKEEGTVERVIVRNSTELERYIFGESGTGRDLTEILDMGDMIFTDKSLEVECLNFELIMGRNNKDIYNFYIKYEENAYKFQVINEYDDTDIWTTDSTEEIELIYTPKGREGKKVLYDSNNDGINEEWMILYDNDDNVEMVSMSNAKELTLGVEDEKAQIPGDIDKDGTENTNVDKVIYSYNNAISRLNSYCAELVTNTNKLSVRSIGSNPSDPLSENNTLYTSEKLSKWAEGRYNGIGKRGDINFEQDLIRMSFHGCNVTEDVYWLASRMINEDLNNEFFNVPYISDGYFNMDYLWYVNYSGYAFGISRTYGVRPVVKVNSSGINIMD